MKQVFLSYSRQDAKHARKLFKEMSSWSGISVWFDIESLIPGTKWEPAIRKAIRDSRYFVALFSRSSSSTKGFRDSELEEAIKIMSEMPDGKIFLIPVRLEECKPPRKIVSQLHFADFFESWSEGVQRLQLAVGAAPTVKRLPGFTKKQKPTKRMLDRPPATQFSGSEGGYLYKVHLVDLTRTLPELPKVAAGLNAIQSFVRLVPMRAVAPAAAEVSEDGLPQLNIDALRKGFYKGLRESDADRILDFTDRLLMYEDRNEPDRYHYLGLDHSEYERVGFASVYGLDIYRRMAGLSFEAALSYQIVDDLTSYFLDIELHKQTRGCPLDYTYDHADQVVGLKEGHFCSDCLKKLKKNPPLKQAMEKMLQWGR